ncbi:hypothetical protein [Kitasatospora fiedleri]|uniref:hypothetical protein n=1 Tax=Kitasatospora fiedleri TaxID=2991545 RepID=UPI00249B1C21|nr:hypothetical protein [Kitasatospora fiedleri]
MNSPTTPSGDDRPPLHEPAAAGRLPDHRTMDRPTLARIAGRRPGGPGARPRLPHPATPLVPDPTWFARPESATSLHGVLHGARVAVLVQLLGPDRAFALAAPASCHDCRRRNDRTDAGHGARAAHWLTRYPTDLSAAFGHAPSPEAVTAVALHDVPHHASTPEQRAAYQQHRTAVDLLKAADALDRYRLPATRWWPDLHLLRPDGNAMLTALATGRPVHLLHLTRSLDAIRTSGHLRAFDRHRHALTRAEAHQVTRSVTDRVRAAAPLLDLMLAAAATGRTRPDAGPFLDQLAAAVTVMPYLGHLCFETAAEYLMLHSTSTATKNCAELGEMNNHLYKQLAFTAVDTMGALFDVGRFRPGHQRLLDLIDGIEPGLSQSAAAFVRDRLAHRFTATALTPAADATTFAFTGAGTDDLRTAAAPLLGQLLFREVRLLDRYPQLYQLFEQEKAAEAWTHWNGRRTALPYNAACGPKGEIGVNPVGPHAQVTVWTAERCTRGLLHRAEQVAAVPAPRLAPWAFSALRDRRDEDRWKNRAAALA